jgi:flagellar hook protein FlgE
MMRGMFAAISGLKTHQIALDVTANDISNVNTIGYKSSRTTFSDTLTQLQRGGSGAGGGVGGSNPAQVGLGVQLGSIDNLMGGGASQPTGNVKDVAIQGAGFFRVGRGTPTPGTPTAGVPTAWEYTRAGNFTTNSLGYLMTQDGFYVVGKENVAGAPGPNDVYLEVPPGSTDLAIGPDGSVSYTPAGGGPRVTAGFISLATFPNEAGLERASSNRWRESNSSGAPDVDPAGVGNKGLTVSGVIEMSNVDLATEFTDMISAQRGFQANSRVISTADEMLQDLVNLKR